MIPRAALGLAALLGSAAPLVAAEGGAIRTGEHDGFTRVVLTIEPTTEWSLETDAGRATLHFPGRKLAFGTDEAFDRIPRTRVLAISTAADAAGTDVTVDLGCDCRISASFVGARYLALDIADRDAVAAALPPTPAAESPEHRSRREAAVVATAEQILLRQIERAADQGLVRLSEQGPPAPPEEPEAAAATPIEPPDTPADAGPALRPADAAEPGKDSPALAEDDPSLAASLSALNDQIEATTVFDRDGRNARSDAQTAKVPEVCLPDERLDVGAWSNDLPFDRQLPPLRRRLIGEFDVPDPVAVGDLARLYIRFGLGVEAELLLGAFASAGIEDRALLVDLARVVEAGPEMPEGPLAIGASCPGRHGLWLALGGVAPAFRDADSFAEVQAAFGALPPEMRAMLAPRLIDRLIDSGHVAEARLIYETAIRPGERPDAGLALADARLAAAEGHPIEAAKGMSVLLEASGHTSVEALIDLVRVALDAGLPIPDRIVVDLRAAALQYRGSDLEPDLRALLTELLASRSDLPEALREARAAIRDMPAESARFADLAVRAIAAADPATVGPAAYAGTALGATDLVTATAATDPARDAIAAKLIDIGLPQPALAMLPASKEETDARRLISARARLRLGEPTGARATLASMPEPEAAELRARAFALDGAWDQALATLDSRGLDAVAAPYVWPSGAWSRIPDTAAEDPKRLAMARYMMLRSGEAAPSPPADDPAALPPEAAFAEPLPPLDRPSLAAARRLIATGGQIGGLIEGVLADEGQ